MKDPELEAAFNRLVSKIDAIFERRMKENQTDPLLTMVLAAMRWEHAFVVDKIRQENDL